MKSEVINAMLATYQSWAHSLCAPVFWQEKGGASHNGTVTFLRTEKEVLGITNRHVADGLMGCTEEIGNRCQIGNAYLDPGRLIARHPQLDLATFQLSDIFLTQAGNRFRAATVPVWPPTPPSENAPAMFGGFPAIYRKSRDDGSVDFSFAWFAGKVQSSSRKNVGIVLDIARSIVTSPLPRIPANADLGGWSGGPVFRIIDEGRIERLELAAIIYEYSPINEITLAHPLLDLAKDGNFIS